MSDILFYPSVENEILMAATALWRAGGNGDRYRCFLNAADYDRQHTKPCAAQWICGQFMSISKIRTCTPSTWHGAR